MTGIEAFEWLAADVPLPDTGLAALAAALRSGDPALLGPHPDRM